MMNQLNRIVNHLELGELLSHHTVSGGSINDAYQIKTERGKFFLKLNSSTRFPQMFEAESRGLKLLRKSNFNVPEPLQVGVVDNAQFILMKWIDQGSPNQDFWSVFGRSLAELHSISSKGFGLDHDNYIGSLPQQNEIAETWAEFYQNKRLIPQIEMARANGRLTSKMAVGFDSLFEQLPDLFPKEKPSLLHGDLWSGNMMTALDGSPSIFDPAVYYGHREMDMAMMALFGGFGNSWVEAYNEVYPLESGWQERIPLGQLYPLMVHVNLFGGGYAGSVERILSQFI
jgi:fructosamine-3-kinase